MNKKEKQLFTMPLNNELKSQQEYMSPSNQDPIEIVMVSGIKLKVHNLEPKEIKYGYVGVPNE